MTERDLHMLSITVERLTVENAALRAELEKAREEQRSLAFSLVESAKLGKKCATELIQSEAALTEALAERDRAQEALQDTHIALGGDGEWVGKMPPMAPPDSGDLHLDVPVLAGMVAERATLAQEALDRAAKAEAERDDLREAMNTPEVTDFVEGVKREAAHQRERWGVGHDAGKSPEDWLWLLSYLATKATQAARYGDTEKYYHHIVTCGAACANWHANATGANTSMRPGVDPAKYAALPQGQR